MPNSPYFGYPHYDPYNGFQSNDVAHNKKEAHKFGASPIIELFGIKLFLDDLIILGLLFFLYQEKVKDDMLYIILILLLLS